MRVIFAEFSLVFWGAVAQTLNKEQQWEICYWLGKAEMQAHLSPLLANQNFVFHISEEAIRGLPAPALADLPLAALDSQELERYSPHQNHVLTMMDRMDLGYTFSYSERMQLYYRYLSYWLAVLQHMKPDLVVFPISPHVAYDYVLYFLAQDLGIPTLLFERASLPGYVFPVQSFEQGSPALLSHYRHLLASGAKAQLSPTSQAYVDSMRAQNIQAMPDYSNLGPKSPPLPARTWQRFLQPRRYWQKLAYTYERIYKKVKPYLEPVPRNYMKQRWIPMSRSRVTARQLRWYWDVTGPRLRHRWYQYYHQLTQDPQLDKPYIFFPLHYQPERTTAPGGGSYVHQDLAVKLLAANLPEGWHMVVKEHPRQITDKHGRSRGEMSRSMSFYDALAETPGVILAPLSFSSQKLIDGARAVVTLTGSPGWEAVLRNKPAIVLGYASYRGCEGVFYTPDGPSCAAALGQIAGGYQVNPEKVDLFIQAIETIGQKAWVDSAWSRAAGISLEENSQRLVQTWADFPLAPPPYPQEKT